MSEEQEVAGVDEPSQPSAFERERTAAAADQTETPADWTSPDEQLRETRGGSDTRYAGRFRKLLEHDATDGLLTDAGVDEYEELVEGIKRSDGAVLDAISRANEGAEGPERRWINPRAANAGTMKGAHPSVIGDTRPEAEEVAPRMELTAPPAVDSPAGAAELVEAYLFAVCRDVAFRDYGTGERTDRLADFEPIPGDAVELMTGGRTESVTEWAADRLQATLETAADRSDDHEDVAALMTDLGVATNADGRVTPAVLFRGDSRRESPTSGSVGPYHSQFLLQRLYPLFPSGCAPYVADLTGVTELDLDALAIERHVPIANRREFGVTFDDYVSMQNGEIPHDYREDDFEDDEGRYPYIGRDMGTHVHTDGPYQEYYRAATVLTFWDFPRTPLSPYTTSASPNEADGATFGPVDAFSLVGAVSYEAFKAAWTQKWRSFRRLRPEAMAGLVELDRNRSTDRIDEVPLDDTVDAAAPQDVIEVVERYNDQQRAYRFLSADATADTALLGQMYPEGSPTHPAYPSGHATMAGAGVTVLKAIFDETAPITDTGMRPVGIDPEDPTSHVFIDRGVHADPAVSEMTVGTELDKLASNIAHARMFGGVHYRTDGERGIRLGEQVAIRFLQDHLRSYPEGDFGGSFKLTLRDGQRVRITPTGVETIEAD